MFQATLTPPPANREAVELLDTLHSVQVAGCRANLHVELEHSIKQVGLSQLRLRQTALVPFAVFQQAHPQERSQDSAVRQTSCDIPACGNREFLAYLLREEEIDDLIHRDPIVHQTRDQKERDRQRVLHEWSFMLTLRIARAVFGGSSILSIISPTNLRLRLPPDVALVPPLSLSALRSVEHSGRSGTAQLHPTLRSSRTWMAP
jgi:hypothetical protein